MGGYLSLKQPNANRISSLNLKSVEQSTTVDVPTYTEEFCVPDHVAPQKPKSRSMFLFRKTASLHSPNESSFQQETESRVEQQRRFIETLKADHENEVFNLCLENKQLVAEVSRLRNEVKTLHSSLPKLRADKQNAMSAEKDALDRANAFERQTIAITQERDSLRQQLEESRKEVDAFREQYQLNKPKCSISQQEAAPQHPITDWLFASQSESQIHVAKDEDNSLETVYFDDSDREMEESIKRLLGTLQHQALGVPEDNLFTLYLEYTNTTQNIANDILLGCEELSYTYEMEGKIFNFFFYNQDTNYPQAQGNMQLEMLNESHIFVSLSKEARMMHRAVQAGKVCIALPNLNESFKDQRERIHIINDDSQVAENCLEKINDVCKMFIEKQTLQENIGSERGLPTSGVDTCSHAEQRCIQQQQQKVHGACIDIDHHLAFLDAYITQDGVVQPLLLKGPIGSGKSFILSNWVTHLEASLKNSCILYHATTAGSNNSRNPVQLFRRFFHILTGRLPQSCQEEYLVTEFPKSLSVFRNKYTNGIIIVIDGADLMQNNEKYFNWLQEPLPGSVRVILSVSSHKYPATWNNWTSREVRGNATNGLENIVARLPGDMATQFEHEILTLHPDGSGPNSTTSNLSNCLFRELFVAACVHIPNIDLQELTAQCMATTKLKDLCRIIIALLVDVRNNQLLSQLLCLLAISHNGLSMMELIKLCGDFRPAEICEAIQFTHKLHLTWHTRGLVQLSRKQVKEGVIKYFSLKDENNVEFLQSLRYTVIQLFNEKFTRGFVTYRVADELPWQLLQVGNMQGLGGALESVRLFLHHVENGSTEALVSYWDCVGYDLPGIHNFYMEQLKFSEQNQAEVNADIEFAYQALGEFMQEVGELRASQECFERALEFMETYLEPDSIKIGEAHLHLAKLFVHWKKYQTAENCFEQALDIIKSNEQESTLLPKVLEPFSSLLLHLNKPDQGNVYRAQAAALRQKDAQNTQRYDTPMEFCAQLAHHLAEEKPDAERSQHFVDIASVWFNLNQIEKAGQMLEKAINLNMILFGEEDERTAEVMSQLGYVYSNLHRYDEATLLLEKAFPVLLQRHSFDLGVVQSALKNLVKVYNIQRKYDKVENLCRDVIRYEDEKQQSSPALAATMNLLAVHLSKQERCNEALPLYFRAIHIYNDHSGFENDHVSEILNNIAKSYFSQNDEVRATHFYRLSFEKPRTIDQLNPPHRV